MPKIQLFLKTLRGTTTIYEVDSAEKVQSLKEKIYSKEGIIEEL